MTDDELINAGYTKYKPVPYNDCVVALFQKCVRDKYGKKYFININKWDFSRYEHDHISYETEVQFEHKNGETVEITAFDGWTIPQLEKFYEDIWSLGWFKYYEVSDAHRGEVEAQY